MSVLSTSKNQMQKQSLFEFTHGIDLDVYLARQEILVQKAWADSLSKINGVSQEECHLLKCALDEALLLIQSGEFDWRMDDEDIHMNLERFLVSKLGDLGKKIHLGRSRNDLIATTLRLFVNDSLNEVGADLRALIIKLSDQAEKWVEVIVPGMTHLQNGQPIRFGHILAGHGWAFYRDFERLEFSRKEAMRAMPLGSAALAGTTLDVDLKQLANELGFESAPLNSYDAVGDRDFIMSALSVFSLIGVHLSRISEDCIIWSSTPVGFLKLPPQWSTGSSIMPNKRNPDVPELIRAKSAHLISVSMNAQVLMKGLPTSYNSDLHELKRIYIGAVKEVKSCLKTLGAFISEIQVDSKQAQSLLEKGHLLATEIANAMTAQGVPFREAYAQTAALVELAESQGVSIEKLKMDQIPKSSVNLGCLHLEEFTYSSAVESRKQSGGTSLRSAMLGIQKLKSQINKN